MDSNFQSVCLFAIAPPHFPQIKSNCMHLICDNQALYAYGTHEMELWVEAEVSSYYVAGSQFSVTDTHNLHDFSFNSPDLREFLKYVIAWRSKHELSVLL